MAGTPAVFMPGASMAQRWSIIIMAAAAGTAAAAPLPVRPLARRPSALRWALSLPLVPAGCPYQVVGGTNYYVCNGTWYQPYYGNNGLYYRVVPPL